MSVKFIVLSFLLLHIALVQLHVVFARLVENIKRTEFFFLWQPVQE